MGDEATLGPLGWAQAALDEDANQQAENDENGEVNVAPYVNEEVGSIESDDEEYLVETVLSHRFYLGHLQYLLRFEGYGPAADMWIDEN